VLVLLVLTSPPGLALHLAPKPPAKAKSKLKPAMFVPVRIT